MSEIHESIKKWQDQFKPPSAEELQSAGYQPTGIVSALVDVSPVIDLSAVSDADRKALQQSIADAPIADRDDNQVSGSE